MKLIQINGWLGRLNGPLERFLLDQKPDFICIQEAFDPDCNAPTFKDQFMYVSEIIEQGKFQHYSFAPAWGFEMIGTKIDTGNIIISKYPLTNQVKIHTNNSYNFRKELSNSQPNTRVWQACTAEIGNAKKLAISTHQGYLPQLHHEEENNDITVASMQKAIDGLNSLDHPLIFCGDLNSHPETPPIKLLEKETGLKNLVTENNVKSTLSEAHRAPEHERNSVVCDYIFVSDDIKVEKFSVSEEVVSDHKALILEFSL